MSITRSQCNSAYFSWLKVGPCSTQNLVASTSNPFSTMFGTEQLAVINLIYLSHVLFTARLHPNGVQLHTKTCEYSYPMFSKINSGGMFKTLLKNVPEIYVT
jgi:hypothetical protein